MKVYADTSFLLPLYISDSHTLKSKNRMAAKPFIFLTSFQVAEMAHAIFQQAFRKSISVWEAQCAYSDFERDCESGLWVLVNQPDRTFQTCAAIGRRQVAKIGVRTLDSLHVAAALELKADRFWTFDERQARLAEAEGLVTL